MIEDKLDYRYLLIHDKNSSIIYCECVEWQVGEFDRLYPKNKQQFKNGISAISFSTLTSVHTIDEAKKNISLTFDEVHYQLNYSDRFTDFITKNNDENLFSPLIDRCSNVDVLITEISKKEDRFDWLSNNRESIQKINGLYGVNFKTNPQLINTFSIYHPSRILINIKFPGKIALKKGEQPKEMIVVVLDEFNKYQDAKLEINLRIKDEIYLTETLSISQNQIKINLKYFPDSIEFICVDNHKIIYEQRSTFVRNINIQGDIVVGSIDLPDRPNGSMQEIISRMDLVIGDANE
jgi:hypothetical protein